MRFTSRDDAGLKKINADLEDTFEDKEVSVEVDDSEWRETSRDLRQIFMVQSRELYAWHASGQHR